MRKNRGISGFPGFPCRDASLRNEGCFFLVPAGRSLLRSTTVPERNRGRSPCITARVFIVFVGKEYTLSVICCAQPLRPLRLGERKIITARSFLVFVKKGIRVVRDLLSTALAFFATWRENHSRGNRMGINPTPTAAECCKYLSISGLRRF